MPSTADIIKVNRAIVHKVDRTRGQTAPELSDLETPLNDDVENYLGETILVNLEHKNTHDGIFDTSASPQVMQTFCDDLLGEPRGFARKSKDIAQRLFDAMDARTSPGNLVVAMFTKIQEQQKWLALLKLDPYQAFVGEARRDASGHVQIELKRVDNVLTTGELQKCAFVLPQSLRTQVHYDLRVLDQQLGRFSIRRRVASFFSDKFLQCKLSITTSAETNAYVRLSTRWAREKTQWPADQQRHFIDRLTQSLEDKIVDIPAFAAEVMPALEDQTDYVEFIQAQGMQNLTFRPDPETTARFTQYVRFEGDDGLQLRINRDAADNSQTFRLVHDDVTNKDIITIQTTNVRRKL